MTNCGTSRRTAFHVRLFLSAILLTTGAMAQEDTAALTGTATDASQGVVQHADVEVANKSTGFLRTGQTNEYGRYYFNGIPVGVYQLTLHKDGFRAERIESVQLVVGQTRTINVQMQVATLAQDVQVTVASGSLNENSAEVGAVLVNTQVAQLPLNGRSWISEMAFAPGAIDMGGGTQRSIRFAGHGVDDNNYRFDGIDATGVANQSQNTSLRLQTSTEAIAEFRVDSMLFTAETGGTIGGQVQAVSKSGTNDFHGSTFEYLRNDKLDARAPFDKAILPPLHLNQFGTNLGGRIVKNRTFFFVSYEGLRQTQGTTLIGFVPSDSYRARAIAQSPAITPLLAAYPEGTSPVNADIWRRTAQGQLGGIENSGMIRIDHRLSDATTIFARLNIDQGDLVAPSGQLADSLLTTNHPMNGTVQLFHIFSPTMTNQLELGVNRAYQAAQTDGALGSVSNLPYSLAVAGFTTLNQTKLQIVAPTTYSILDNWTWIRGQHTLKAGVEIKKVNYDYNVAAQYNLIYANINAFAANNLNEFDVVGGIPMVGDHKTMYFGYLQDEWRIRPNLTVNTGLRYEFFNAFHEIYGRDLPFSLAACNGYCAYGSAFLYPPKGNVEPRVAIVWSPERLHGKTVIRSGFGMYKGEGQLGDTKLPSDNFTQNGYKLSSAQIPNLSYPLPVLTSNATVPAAPRDLQRVIANPTVLQWGLQIQQALPGGLILDTGYIGNHGYHQFIRTDVNVINPATGQRSLAAFGQIDAKEYEGVESFHAWQTSLRRQLTSGWLLSANYMWSHSINDGSSGGGDSTYPQNVACLSCEKGSSDQDIRHTLTVNSVYKLPFGRGQRFLNSNGFITNTLFRGWQLSAIATARSGDPVNIVISRTASAVPDGNANPQAGTTVQRPNLVPGVSLTPPGGSSIQEWINPAAFAIPASGTWGNLGRNVFRGPSHWQADLALVKTFPVRERLSFDFRAEAFNIFNHPQFGDPNNVFGTPSFGSITSTVNSGATGNGTARIYEFAVRLNY